jgi:hypothetical protein
LDHAIQSSGRFLRGELAEHLPMSMRNSSLDREPADFMSERRDLMSATIDRARLFAATPLKECSKCLWLELICINKRLDSKL